MIQLKGQGGGEGRWGGEHGDINQSETSLETIYCQWGENRAKEKFLKYFQTLSTQIINTNRRIA
jgi:hypothetical protein